MFFDILRHLLPNARAWRLTVLSTLRKYLTGLMNGFGPDVKAFYDGLWEDLFPATTRSVPAWEAQFGLANTLTDMADRRSRLDAAWKATGGQDPQYLQDTLQNAGFDVYVHEWWVPGTEPALNTIAAATARDPNTYLGDGEASVQFLSCDGASDMQDGDPVAQDGASTGPSGYALVNKLSELLVATIGDGSDQMYDGGISAMDGGRLLSYSEKQYAIPSDPTVFPYFIYIGGAIFPDKAIVSMSRKNEFEQLCLKICPAQLWIGILVQYS